MINLDDIWATEGFEGALNIGVGDIPNAIGLSLEYKVALVICKGFWNGARDNYESFCKEVLRRYLTHPISNKNHTLEVSLQQIAVLASHTRLFPVDYLASLDEERRHTLGSLICSIFTVLQKRNYEESSVHFAQIIGPFISAFFVVGKSLYDPFNGGFSVRF